MVLTNATLPDTSSVVMDMSMNLDECKASCLKNCSCTGYATADVRDGGRGCIMWVTELADFGVISGWGQDLYIRLAAADLESISGHTKKKRRIVLPLTVSIVSGVLVIMAFISMCIWTVKKRRRKGLMTSTGIVPHSNDNKNDSLELPFFHLDAVITATNNFAEENILGEGGFGPVYKGKLEEGQEIAVKRLSKTSVQGIDEFKNELMLIAKLQHRNLVRLLGYSIHGEERMLIYEFMPNKSLDAFLFDKHKGVLLDWENRHNIILGIARGLLYLHQDSRFRIIHRDLKASNILLDKEMNPKISDFGMARISGEEGEASTKTRKVVGTYGYMSPEYAMDGIFSVKSDVYSFGVLVLEIISGQKNKGAYLADPHLYLLGMAWNLWNEGKSIDLIDPSMYFDSMGTVEIMRCINVGLLCVQEHPEDRPTMASVLFMLGNGEAPLPKPRPPGFMAGSASRQIESSSKDEELHSANHATLTIIVGR
ncbi:hypothetical protein J5N97_011775 [Dioscorea zingiberensis]|uniref:Uncharacterized protein n=1 Tax=Dioscorea zingiberensis TaxID=325984 RepID=A0A9D5HNN6_9LILI|nr:hypothetical protein J5N97_011775 [Dioscorea zingiberensis]